MFRSLVIRPVLFTSLFSYISLHDYLVADLPLVKNDTLDYLTQLELSS